MQTNFSASQLADPAMASSEAVIRKCVHCGFCTATCPTYVLLGDELDSPRGRIYLMKDMLEEGRTPDAELVKHVDRCLSCLSCMTTCPSGVNYMHLVDHARAYIHRNYRRPLHDRFYRALIAALLPYPKRFRFALRLAPLARPLAPLFARLPGLGSMAAMLALAPSRLPRPSSAGNSAVPGARGRIILLQGCAEPVLKPEYRNATIRLLNRIGYDVLFARGEACCGALVQHMGREDQAMAAARGNVDAWWEEIARGDIKAIVMTASGCGTVVKDYAHQLRNDPAYADKAAACAALARDVSELLADENLVAYRTADRATEDIAVAYHAACSLQHGQKLGDVPKLILQQLGFQIKVPAESHLCCGSAGIYNIMQPEIAGQLAKRKATNIARLKPDIIATGNIGCAVQIGNALDVPVVHTIELVDWATGGPAPVAMQSLVSRSQYDTNRA